MINHLIIILFWNIFFVFFFWHYCYTLLLLLLFHFSTLLLWLQLLLLHTTTLILLLLLLLLLTIVWLVFFVFCFLVLFFKSWVLLHTPSLLSHWENLNTNHLYNVAQYMNDWLFSFLYFYYAFLTLNRRLTIDLYFNLWQNTFV